MASCIFCKIVAGEIPATRLAETDQCLAFRDINAQAPTHILVIPKQHIDSMNDVTDTALMGAMTAMAQSITKSEGIAASGYRLVVNTGADGGQMVQHLHLHILAGRKMKWPPG